MWKRLTTFGKFVVIMFSILPFYLVLTITTELSARSNYSWFVIIILFILCGIGVAAICAEIVHHHKDMRKIEEWGRMKRE
jgi:ABC-type polysaccharide/polyol phosphate export permease